MNKDLICGIAFIAMTGSVIISGGAAAHAGQSGERLFMQHCAVCHPGGGNIINPQKTLFKKDREANGVTSARDIVKIMRSPGPGMTKFDEKTISDKDAGQIADYIMMTFK